MKFTCHCGATVFDHGGEQAHKAHIVADQDWDGLLTAIDAAIEASGPTADDKEAACMHVRALVGKLSRPAWQCSTCGRIYLHDRSDALQAFTPQLQSAPTSLFAGRALWLRRPGST